VDVGLREFGKECGFVLHWYVAKISERRDKEVGELLARQVDIILVDRDGLSHRRTTSRRCW